MRRFVLAVVLSGCLGQAAIAEEISPSKLADIKQLMEITGSANIAKQFAGMVSQQVLQMLKASRQEIPTHAVDVMNKELLQLFSERMSVPGGLTDQIIPIYDKYLTQSEIKELLAFYQTPIGKKAISVLPKVVNESMLTGQKWGQSLGSEIDKRVKAVLTKEGLMPTPPHGGAPAPAPAPLPAPKAK